MTTPSSATATPCALDVVGIGNAIVDIIGRCDDAFLARHGAPKGHMRLVDTPELMALYSNMGPGVEISGGSAANTIAGIASLGGKTGFIGKVGRDTFGEIFTHDVRAQGVTFGGEPAPTGATSRSLILVTPDGERTMNTYLGVSTQFTPADLDAKLIASAGIVYLEGYLFDGSDATQAFRSAVAMARAAHRKVALSLSDSFCVDRHRAELLAFIRSGVDIVFANESEICSLYETTDFDVAARAIGADVPLAALTRGSKGSVVVAGAQLTTIPVHAVATVVDTTGAGDLYAGGFLYGLARGASHETCGRFGSLASAEIISHLGARPQVSLATLAAEHGIRVS
jgi:sugar/nucleoside kinase (ribokinase family)